MKKLLLLTTLCMLLALTLSLSLQIGATDNTVTVNGSTTLADALSLVPDGGTVKIEDTYTIPADFNWTAHNKTVTVTGGVLDFTNFGNNGHFHIRDNVTFTEIELKFAIIDWNAENNDGADAKSNGIFPRTNIYANGYDLTIAADVTFTEGQTYNTNVCLFGGSKGGTVNGDTDLTVLAGWYTYIFGGGHGGTVNGSTHVTVGGNVNATAVISNHDTNYNAYGGGWDDNITGSTYLTVQDNARLIYAYGGSHGGSSKVGGTTNVSFTGGTLMSIYGAHNSGANTATAGNVLMTGGTVDQIFGASNGAHFGTAARPVDVNVTVLGGTVARRIYGGYYNNFANYGLNDWMNILAGRYGTWSSTYQVYGSITVIISDAANLALNTDNDRALYARSRLSVHNSTGAIPTADEKSTLIFLGSYQGSKLKALDTTMKKIMETVATAADEIHTLTYAAAGAVITQSCSGQGHDADASAATIAATAHSATATLATASNAVYTGSAIKNVRISYGSGWLGEPLSAVSYANNLNAGTATASATCHGVTATLFFTIEKASVPSPAASLFTVKNESVKGKADGSITGLTAAMEYSTDGMTYLPATGDLSALASGSYYLRYAAADDNHHASAPLVLTVAADKTLTVTFKVDGQTYKTVEVDWGNTLSSIPTVPAKKGYDKVAPVWMSGNTVAVFSDMRESMTVTAKYTINRYTVTFRVEGEADVTRTVTHGSAVTDIPEIPVKRGYDKTPAVWSAALDTVLSDLTVTPVYTKNPAGTASNTTEGQAATLTGNGWEDVITDGDRAEMELGENVSVYLQTTGGQLTETEQAALEALLNGYTAGPKLTVSLFKQVGSTTAVKLDSTAAKLAVTLQIPEELRSSERQYKLIALRNGEATAAEATYDATAQTLTLETDDFNTVYAFAYLDPAPTPEPAVKNGSSTLIIVIVAAVLGVVGFGGGAAALVVIKKKKKA